MPVAQKWLKEFFIMGWSYNFYFYWHYSVAIFVLHISMSTHTNFEFSNSQISQGKNLLHKSRLNPLKEFKVPFLSVIWSNGWSYQMISCDEKISLTMLPSWMGDCSLQRDANVSSLKELLWGWDQARGTIGIALGTQQNWIRSELWTECLWKDETCPSSRAKITRHPQTQLHGTPRPSWVGSSVKSQNHLKMKSYHGWIFTMCDIRAFLETSLAVQWRRPHGPMGGIHDPLWVLHLCRGPCLIPGRGASFHTLQLIAHMPQLRSDSAK